MTDTIHAPLILLCSLHDGIKIKHSFSSSTKLDLFDDDHGIFKKLHVVQSQSNNKTKLFLIYWFNKKRIFYGYLL